MSPRDLGTADHRTGRPGRPGRPGRGTMLRITGRIQRRAACTWMLLLGAGMIGTAASIAGLYDTPAKIRTYAEAVTAGNALLAINGKVEGIGSLGGVIQDEFGFMAAFLLPLLGISLVARATRQEEEAGRLELLLGGRVARHEPTTAALVVATLTILGTGVLFTVGLVVFGVPLGGAALYALSLGTLAFVFANLAAVLAQLTLHARGVYTWSLLVLAAAYVLRGVGDVTTSWVTWLSPLGWAEKTAPFGHQRWWVLAVPVGVGLVLGAASLGLAARRDLGSALSRGGAGPERATAQLCRPIGLAVRIHRPATLGWLAGGVLLTAMMGTLSQQLLEAMRGNSALGEALGVTGARPRAGLVAATQLYLAVLATGYVVQAVGALRVEEASGRLETRLCGTLSRWRWLAAHALVVLVGLVTVVLASSTVLALTTSLSAGGTSQLGSDLGSALAYLPAELVLAGLALAVYGLRPRLFGIAWAAYAATAFLTLLGPGLKLRTWVLDLSPTARVGNPPAGTVDAAALAVAVCVAATLVAVGFVAFLRRGVPQA